MEDLDNDYIKQLKVEGKHYEAGLLLQDYHKRLKVERETALVEMKKIDDNKIERKFREEKKKLGICIACNRVAVKGKSLCEKCYNRKINYNKMREKKNGTKRSITNCKR